MSTFGLGKARQKAITRTQNICAFSFNKIGVYKI